MQRMEFWAQPICERLLRLVRQTCAVQDTSNCSAIIAACAVLH